jgi:DNA-binding Lrp family transcriptional regulator
VRDADETDLQLLHLLQLAPRTPWAHAAQVLSVSANAVAARWSRMREDGLAWLSVYPNAVGADLITATVDVDCHPGRHAAVTELLCRDPRVVSVEECGRGRDLLLTVMVANLGALNALVLDDMATVDGITDTRTSIVTAVHADGADWRLDALDPGQQRRVPVDRVDPAPSALPRNHWPLIEALSMDARISIADLARTTGRTPATARRQLAQLLASGALTLRCDVAPQIAGWPLQCSWLARVPPAEKPQTIKQLLRLRQLRMCLSVTGPANLAFTIFTRAVAEVARFEEAVGANLPALQPIETLIHLRTRKRMGWLIGADGRTTGQLVTPDLFHQRA